jgi:hypothetical protein
MNPGLFRKHLLVGCHSRRAHPPSNYLLFLAAGFALAAGLAAAGFALGDLAGLAAALAAGFAAGFLAGASVFGVLAAAMVMAPERIIRAPVIHTTVSSRHPTQRDSSDWRHSAGSDLSSVKLTATDMEGIVGASEKSVKRKIKLSKNLSDFVRPQPQLACRQIAAVSRRDTPPLTSCLRFGNLNDWSDCA